MLRLKNVAFDEISVSLSAFPLPHTSIRVKARNLGRCVKGFIRRDVVLA
jgi:hypothetical protein